MNPEELQAIGRQLQAVRIERDLSIEEVEAKTRIRAHILESIENGELDPAFTEMQARMKGAVIFDGRNLYSPDEVASAGFVYYSIGRPVAEPAGLYDAR